MLLPILKSYGPWVLMLLGVPILGAYLKNKEYSERVSWILLVLAACVLHIDSIVLGELARHEWGDGGHALYGYFPYLAENYHKGVWLHELAGGVDKYSLGRFGGEYFSIRRILSDIFPMWLSLVFIRIVVSFAAIVGTYLLCHRILGLTRLVSISAGVLYAYGCEFNSTLTFYYGLSLAGLPLLFFGVYSFAETKRVTQAILSLILAVGYVGFADPFYWLPLMWLFPIGIYFLAKKSYSILVIIGQLGIISLLWLVNYADVLKSFADLMPYSGRLVDSAGNSAKTGFLDVVIEHLRWMFDLRYIYNKGSLTFVIPFVISILAVLWVPNKRILFGVAWLCVLAFTKPILLVIPYEDVGIPLMADYTWYLEYGTYSLAIITAAIAVDNVGARRQYIQLSKYLAALYLSISLGFLLFNKIHTIEDMSSRGPLRLLESVPNLIEKDWTDKQVPRVIAIPGYLDRNSVVNYGLIGSSLVGNMVNRGLREYWLYGMPRNSTMGRDMLGLRHGDGGLDCNKKLIFSDYLDMDWLRIANVEYVLSFLPVEKSRMRLLSEPIEGPCARVFDPSAITKRGQYLLDQLSTRFYKDRFVYIYEIPEPMPFAYGIACLIDGRGTEAKEFFIGNDVKNTILGGCGYLTSENAAHFLEPNNTTLDTTTFVSTIEVHMIRDGYRIWSPTELPRWLVVNVPFNRWWVAKDQDGEILKVAELNRFQTLVDTNYGASELVLTYGRPTFSKSITKMLLRN